MNEEGCYYEMGSAVAPPSLREHCSISSIVLFICSLLEANGITYLPFWVTLNRPRPARARRLDTSETNLKPGACCCYYRDFFSGPLADKGLMGSPYSQHGIL